MDAPPGHPFMVTKYTAFHPFLCVRGQLWLLPSACNPEGRAHE